MCVVIKFRAQLKAAQLANISFMSRHIIVCRDISKLWEDKSSSDCDIRHLMTLLSCRDLITLLKELLLSRPKCSVATSISFTTELLIATSPLFFLHVMTKGRHQPLSRPQFLFEISFCRDLVCTFPKFNDQTAFHS